MSKKIYIISTFTDEDMKDFSYKLADALIKKGIEYTPPSFSGKAAEHIKTPDDLFKAICGDIKKAKKILFIAHDETTDWGASLGFAYALGKEIIILTQDETYISFMTARMKNKILRVKDIKDTSSYIDTLTEVITQK